jgi:hypothetical protein
MLTTATIPLTAPANIATEALSNEAPLLQTVAFQAAAIIAVLAIPSVAALLMDVRQLDDVSVWDKPLKFEASLVLHFVTLGLVASLFTPQAAARRIVRLAYHISAAAAVVEMAYLVLQAARGRASHFNFDTDIESTMYRTMGVGALLLVLSSFAIGYALLSGAKPDTGRGLRLGAAWGLMLGSIATLVAAGIMSSGLIDGQWHWVGGVHSDAGGLPLTGWSRSGGDLRVPHFFATHMMQALPLLGLVVDHYAKHRAALIVAIGAVGMIAAVAFTFAQAVGGHPFLPA